MSRVLIFDTETTSTKDPGLVEAAWVEVANGVPGIVPVDRFYSRYNPGKPIECGAMATHHIMDEDVSGCPPAAAFRLPGDTAYLVGHHIDFDWGVVKDTCGLPYEPRRICTLALCRSLWPEADCHTLAAMCYRLAPSEARQLCPKSHNALDDVNICRVVLFNILRQIKPETWEELWKASERARVPTIMPVGKHKGLPMSQVPRDYKQWFLRQPDVDPYLAQALRA